MDGKGKIRQEMRARRRAVDPAARAAASEAVCRALLQRNDVKAACAAKKMFAAYLALPDELDVSALIRHLWAEGCPVVVPTWRNGSYGLVRHFRDTRLVRGPMNILEPEAAPGETIHSATEPSVWIVPGLAFTRTGQRLGYGGGWYDRFLAAAAPTATALGVAYDFQMLETLPADAHDISLTGVVSAAL